jgi:hypothetical protein
MTQTEQLYQRYISAATATEKEDCRRRLACICLKAIGHLTPPWRGKWHPDFLSLRFKARAPWVFRWLDEQLRIPQKDGCRYIGRRCRFALIKDIRRYQSQSREERAAWRRGQKVGAGNSDCPVHIFTPLEQRQELMSTFGLYLRYSTKGTQLTADEKVLTLDSILHGSPLRNTTVAKEWGKSEGYVRKVKKRLLAKMRKAKKKRREHWEKRMKEESGNSYRQWASAARRDNTAWWDKRRGKPFAINLKK